MPRSWRAFAKRGPHVPIAKRPRTRIARCDRQRVLALACLACNRSCNADELSFASQSQSRLARLSTTQRGVPRPLDRMGPRRYAAQRSIHRPAREPRGVIRTIARAWNAACSRTAGGADTQGAAQGDRDHASFTTCGLPLGVAARSAHRGNRSDRLWRKRRNERNRAQVGKLTTRAGPRERRRPVGRRRQRRLRQRRRRHESSLGAPTTCIVGTQGCLCDSTGGCAPNLTCTPQTFAATEPLLQRLGLHDPPPAEASAKSCSAATGAPSCTPGITIPPATGTNDNCGYPASSFVESTTIVAHQRRRRRLEAGHHPGLLQRRARAHARLRDVDQSGLAAVADPARRPLSADRRPRVRRHGGATASAGRCSSRTSRSIRRARRAIMQKGGPAYDPIAIFGSWKSATEGDAGNVGTPAICRPGGEQVEPHLFGRPGARGGHGRGQEDYGAELRFEVGLISGHSYRFQVIAHDGDQNKGGDSGEACAVFCAGTGSLCDPGVTECGQAGAAECPTGQRACRVVVSAASSRRRVDGVLAGDAFTRSKTPAFKRGSALGGGRRALSFRMGEQYRSAMRRVLCAVGTIAFMTITSVNGCSSTKPQRWRSRCRTGSKRFITTPARTTPALSLQSTLRTTQAPKREGARRGTSPRSFRNGDRRPCHPPYAAEARSKGSIHRAWPRRRRPRYAMRSKRAMRLVRLVFKHPPRIRRGERWCSSPTERAS